MKETIEFTIFAQIDKGIEDNAIFLTITCSSKQVTNYDANACDDKITTPQ